MRGLLLPLTASDAQGQTMNEETYATISRAFIKTARWQLIVTALISGVSLLIAGMHAAVSAIAGGASVVIGGLAGFAMLAMTKRISGVTPGIVLMSLLKAEVIKVLVTVVVLLVTFKHYQGLVPLFLILGLTGSALTSGVGLRAMNNESHENNK